MFSTITCTVDDPIATTTLNRPDRLNALTGQMLAELRQALVTAEEDECVVAILLTGARRGFCAGADIARLQATSEGKTRSSVAWDGEDRMPGDFDMMGADYRPTRSCLPDGNSQTDRLGDQRPLRRTRFRHRDIVRHPIRLGPRSLHDRVRATRTRGRARSELDPPQADWTGPRFGHLAERTQIRRRRSGTSRCCEPDAQTRPTAPLRT